MDNFLKDLDQFTESMGPYDVSNVSDILYHYTSIQNLKNIVEGKKFHVTRADYLNDPIETIYFFELLYDISSKASNDYSDEWIQSIHNAITNLKDVIVTNHFILSLSKNPDSLSLWNYYGKNDGYNIGIDSANLNSLLNDQKLTYLRGNVIYDMENQVNTITNELKRAYELWIKQEDRYENLNLFMLFLFGRWSVYSLLFKHPGYSNEEEYRYIIVNLNNSLQVNYKSSQGVIVPYIEMNLEIDNKIPLHSVWIGPLIKHNKSILGLSEWLKSLDYSLEQTNQGIFPSNIPLRF